jgi:GAF domain-containing protein
MRESGVPVNLDAPPTSTVEGHRIAADIAQFAAYLQETKAGPAELTRLIIEGAVKLIPAADYAVVRRFAGHRELQMEVATDDLIPRRLMELQNELSEGPCIDAIETGEQIRVADITVETRWPRFAVAAGQLGVLGMLSTPMDLSDRTVGCLALIGTTADFDDEAVSLARIFAVHAGIALSGAARQESLSTALGTREVIGQAKGILMERFKMTEEVAFAALVKVSADNNTKLRIVCEELCNTGVLAPSSPSKRRQRR